jgi:hypothetical protein
MESQKKYQRFTGFRIIFAKMKSVVIFGLLLLSMLSRAASAQEQQVVVPYTLADRDRAIRMEVKLESQQQQIIDLKTLLFWGFGIMFSLFLFMLGYMIWDRRTAMKPALLQASKAMEDNRNFLTVLRDYSKKNPDFAEILRSHGML